LKTPEASPLEDFRQHLAAYGSDYVLLAEHPARHFANIRFLGQFQGRDVIWNACLLALRSRVDDMMPRKQFIEVTPRDAFNYDLRVGLAVPEIDKATILKSIIMIRKYKRLRVGYHKFGPGGE
jgi:hypothetical protein